MGAAYDNQIALLKQLNAPAERVTVTETRRDAMLARYKTSDADISNFIIAKEPVEDYLQIIVIILFALGSLLAGIGRALEMHAGPERR